MLEDLRIMIALQELDREVSEVEGRKSVLPSLIEASSGEFKTAQAEAKAASDGLAALIKAKTSADDDLAKDTERLTKLKLRSTEIKTNKEYFLHLKEIEDCEKAIATIEERSLELMEKLEAAEVAAKEKDEALAAETTRFDAKKVEIEHEFVDDDRLLAELKVKKDELMPKVTAPAAALYLQMVTRYPDSAVVEASGGACSGCRMMIPPQEFNNVRKGEAIIRCSNCQRILYYKD